jgi:hypothetical protein
MVSSMTGNDFQLPGDSGSLVVTADGNVVSLFFAAKADHVCDAYTVGLCIPIDDLVEDILKVTGAESVEFVHTGDDVEME